MTKSREYLLRHLFSRSVNGTDTPFSYNPHLSKDKIIKVTCAECNKQKQILVRSEENMQSIVRNVNIGMFASILVGALFYYVIGFWAFLVVIVGVLTVILNLSKSEVEFVEKQKEGRRTTHSIERDRGTGRRPTVRLLRET